MPSMRAVMESRERAALARVEELRAEFERVRAALADAEEVLNRRVIGLEEYLETLTQLEGPEPAEPAEASGPSEPEPVREPVVDDAAAPSTARARRMVARRKDGVEVDVLGPDYRRIMAVFEKAGGDGLSARQVAVGLGWDVSVPARVEGARGRLKRLVERGWLAESRPGIFTLPERVSAVAAGGGWRGGRGGGS
ncbi:hypothetical protein AB0D13_32140 [Streptomyces sp. NPDC048430]|uniref:hypothetical protein n=1 Tax=Streptomyces sp. NPDC048430 TaxID=3155388 RepID=UPI00343BE89C